MDLWKDSGIKTDASWYVAGILKLEQSKWDFANQNKVEEFLEMIRDQYFSSELSMYAVSFDKKSLAVFGVLMEHMLILHKEELLKDLHIFSKA